MPPILSHTFLARAHIDGTFGSSVDFGVKRRAMKNSWKDLSDEARDRVIEMAWEDRTPFEAIHRQFGLNEAAVIALMRSTLRASSFRLWRERVNSGVSQKHQNKRPADMLRFKCSRQRLISGNKGR